MFGMPESNTFTLLILAIIVTIIAYYIDSSNTQEVEIETNYMKYGVVFIVSLLVFYTISYMYNNTEMMGKVNQFGSSLLDDSIKSELKKVAVSDPSVISSLPDF